MSVLKISQVILLLVISSSKVFSSNNVCSRMENYTVTSMETYTVPVLVNTFTWCLQIPPRCPKTRTEMRQRYRVKTETKTRTVKECCEGYRALSPRGDNDDDDVDDAETGTKCMPICENCHAGVCVSPNDCQCYPGYQGDDCVEACPLGTWGLNCNGKCNCAQGASCDSVTGYCPCPSGYRGEACNETCLEGQWGPECKFLCDCESSLETCHPETGKCADIRVPIDDASFSYPQTSTEKRNENMTVTVYDGESSKVTETSERATEESYDTFPATDNISETMNLETTFISGMEYSQITTQDQETNPPPVDFEISKLETIPSTNVEYIQIKTQVTEIVPTSTTTQSQIGTQAPETTPTPTPEQPQIRPQVLENEASSTTRPAIVLVSVPERRRNWENDLAEFSLKNPFLRHVDENTARDVGAPKTEYVKTVRKDHVQLTPLPLDVALIVVASIVSLGLTSVAVVMILHMRLKLFETARLSIYEEEKMKTLKRDGASTGRISTMGGLPQTPVHVSPLFATRPETGTILTIDNIDPLSNYANGAATIGLRISSNLHDLLREGHYDRPPATLIRLQSDVDPNTEHVYDEIPLQSTPQCARKNA